MEVGLVDVAALGGHHRGVLTGGEAVGGVVEADQLRCPLGRQTDLGSEAGPEALAAPSDLVRQRLDPHLAAVVHHLVPDVRDLRIDRPSRLHTSNERGLRDREPLLPRCARPAVAPGCARRRGPRGRRGATTVPPSSGEAPSTDVRDDRRQPHLQALDVAAAPPAPSPGASPTTTLPRCCRPRASSTTSGPSPRSTPP